MEIANIQVLNGTYGKFYVLDNISYDINFPLNWALNPEKTPEGFICGPSYCQNCFTYGTYNGVFIGYCVPCAGMYNYERGNGFIYCGDEIGTEEYPETSVWNTYLYGVNQDQIGMKCECEFCDSECDKEESNEVQQNEEEPSIRDTISDSSDDLYNHEVKSEQYYSDFWY